ncbi:MULTISPECIES: class I SAM-dependent methyltransferase [unclassified Streptomyces]|uniref:class I SAM-dependent methyltransferase n=1 Tax=unclassified Streptomyces TaxID=2593676 RepID=UPI002E2A16F8|nr:class I SAM-dependent methyltransferase [Streptomyces sp. NBC_00223]
MTTTGSSAFHPHRNDSDSEAEVGADADADPMAEVLDLDAEVLRTYLSELTSWLGGLTDREPRRIVDLGSGTGTGAVALARRFARAEVTAADLSPRMLRRLSEKASALGLADRVHGVEVDLDEDWPTSDTIDLIWAASSLHHLADPARVLARAFDALRPGGLLAVTEMDFFPRFLPDDVGVGRPGLEARVHAALNKGPAVDWTDHLVRAGFVLEAERPFVIDLPAPLPAAAPRYAQASLRRLRSHLDGQLSTTDLAALDTVIDGEGRLGVLRRTDLTVRTTRITWAARRP